MFLRRIPDFFCHELHLRSVKKPVFIHLAPKSGPISVFQETCRGEKQPFKSIQHLFAPPTENSVFSKYNLLNYNEL